VNLTVEPGRTTPAGASTGGAVPFHRLKDALADRRDAPVRIRSEFFDRALSEEAVAALLARPAAIKQAYDPDRLFDFPQAV